MYHVVDTRTGRVVRVYASTRLYAAIDLAVGLGLRDGDRTRYTVRPEGQSRADRDATLPPDFAG